MLMWALRQRIHAKELMRRYNEYSKKQGILNAAERDEGNASERRKRSDEGEQGLNLHLININLVSINR
jgi:hypothetical protein